MEDNRKNNNGMLKSVLSVSSIVIFAKLLGFVKQMVTANAFGATIQTDVIYMAEGLIGNMDYLLIQALSTAFIPIYIHINKGNNVEGRKYVSNIITLFLLVTIVISMLFFWGAPIISRILAPTYSEVLSKTLSDYIRLFSPVLILIVEGAIFNSLLKANKIFVPGELIGVNQSLILIMLVIVIGDRVGPDTLVIGFYSYAFINLIFLMIYARSYWSIQGSNPFIDPNVKRLLIMMGPLLLGYSVVFVNQQVDRIIVSGFDEGTITAMNYAAVLSNFVTAFIGSICGVLFTYITSEIAEDKNEEAAKLTTDSMIQLITVFIPISMIAITNSRDIVQIVFGRGKFDEVAVSSCSEALIGYSVMFVPFVMRELFSRFQYGYEDSKRPMVNSSIAIGINIILSIILSKFIGVIGVTLATSISVGLCGIMNYYSSKCKNSYVRMSVDKAVYIRWIIGICSCLMISVVGNRILLNMSPIIRFMIITSFSMIIYLAETIPIIMPMLKRILKPK